MPSHPPALRFDGHIEFLGLLYQLWAAFNAIFGVAMGLFAASAALLAVAPEGRPGVEIAAAFTAAAFAIVAATAVVWAIVHAWCGGALRRRDPWSRVLALALALLNALLFPLGTVLAFYTVWLLLHEEGTRAVRARDLVSATAQCLMMAGLASRPSSTVRTSQRVWRSATRPPGDRALSAPPRRNGCTWA